MLILDGGDCFNSAQGTLLKKPKSILIIGKVPVEDLLNYLIFWGKYAPSCQRRHGRKARCAYEFPVFTSDIGERSSVLINEAAGVLVKAGISTALARRIVDIL